jgi:hypothetical protein
LIRLHVLASRGAAAKAAVLFLCPNAPLRSFNVTKSGTLKGRLAEAKLCPYYSSMDEETANRIIDLQAEITALRGAVRMLLHNAYNANDSALAILREKAFQADRFQARDEPNERSERYREGVREAVASLLDPFQPDNDEASRLSQPAPARAESHDEVAADPHRS